MHKTISFLVIILAGCTGSFSSDVYVGTLILGRFIQGLGSGAGETLWKAIFRDISIKKELLRYGGLLTVIVTVVIPTTPIIGGAAVFTGA